MKILRKYKIKLTRPKYLRATGKVKIDPYVLN